MYHAGRELDVGPYWLANWLNVVDCIDWERSMWELVDPARRHFVFGLFVINACAAQNHYLFRVRDELVKTVIRADLRETLETRGISGCQYYDLWHSGDDLPRMRWRPGMTGHPGGVQPPPPA
jgi:hypothetical protein